MLFFLLLLHIEPPTSEAASRLILRNSNNPCEGHVEVLYNNIWGYVGDKYWNSSTERVVCRSTHCGEPVQKSKDVERPSNSTVWLNELECKGTEADLWQCEHPGWNISFYPKQTVKKITCSNKIQISLDGFQCAGAVQYSINGEKRSGYFCNDNFGNNEANLLCEKLNCGGSKELPLPEWMSGKAFQSSQKMGIDCSDIGDVKNLWQCTTKQPPSCRHPASVICQNHERLQLRGNRTNVCSGELLEEKNDKWVHVKNDNVSADARCHQMNCGNVFDLKKTNEKQQLTCTDRVEVVLMNNNPRSNCYGVVTIKVNETSKRVCASTWTEKESEVVCRELGCGQVNSFRTKPEKSGIMDYVTCTGREDSLWHCQAKHGKDLSCSSAPEIICADSVKVKLVDGPGRCAGRLAIQYEGQFKRVSNKGWRDSLSDIVCKDLGCGDNRDTGPNPEKFSQGSGEFLTVQCNSGVKNISECTISSSSEKAEAVGITCEEHKMVFLNGSNSCAGEVGIQQGMETYWLSGSEETWNKQSADTVCQQMHCGSSNDFDRRDNNITEVWDNPLICSSTAKTLFECNHTARPPDHNSSIAYVTCSGKIDVKLTPDKCWGTVQFCTEEKCGGICADTLTDEMYEALCEELDCGDKVLQALSGPGETTILFKSLHASPSSASLNKHIFVKAEDGDNTCNHNPAYVVCSGSVKPKFSISRDKCSGNVEMSYEGKMLPVCMDALNNSATQNTICRELECGEAIGKTLAYFGPTPTGDQFISSLQCSGSALAECVVTSKRGPQCKLGGLQCSEWRTMGLEVNEACSGKVVVHSEGKKSSVSSEGWTHIEGQRLCQDLKCGSFKSKTEIPAQVTEANLFWDRNFSCPKNPENIWACENQTTKPSEEKKEKKELFIECQDETKVTLSQECHGEVRINNVPVCASQWNDDYAHMVCQEHDCSNAIIGLSRDKSPQATEKYHVSCDKHHYKLGQCKRVKGKCDDTSLVSVYCVKNVKFNTTQKCGGKIKVNYRNKWEKVCFDDSRSPQMKDKLCRKMGCPGHNASIKASDNKRKDNLETNLICAPEHNNIQHCVKNEPCGNVIPAEIYCNGYEPTIDTVTAQIPVVSIVVSVGFLLVLVILIVVFVRFYVIKKAKKSSVSSRMLPTKEVEFESGDYEDVINKASEMEAFSQGRLRSDAEFVMENDARSASSFSYDDVDEATEARPLTSPAATAAPSGDNYMHDNQSPDGVTYEVDDPQENYDDIEADPEVTQTQAEVHDSPKTTPEIDEPASSILVPTDDDYLVPGQDE